MATELREEDGPHWPARAGQQLLSAIHGNRAVEQEALWRGNGLTQLDRAKALYYAMFWKHSRLIMELLDIVDLPEGTVRLILPPDPLEGSHVAHVHTSFEETLQLRNGCPGRTLLQAAIDGCVPFSKPKEMFEFLLGAGGPGLVLRALDSGHVLRYPGSLWATDGSQYLQDRVFLCSLADLGLLDKTELRVYIAVGTRDLSLLSNRRSSPCCIAPFLQQALEAALRTGWLEGAQLFSNCFVFGPRASYGLMKAAMEDPSLQCLDFLMSLGDEWKEMAFLAAFLDGRFNALEHVVKLGCLPPPGAHMRLLSHMLPCCDAFYVRGWRKQASPSVWAADLQRVITGRFERLLLRVPELTRRETGLGLLTAYVGALLDPETAQHVAPAMRRWRERIMLLFRWWDRESRAHAQVDGSAGQTYLPHVLETILRLAGIATPGVLKRADAVAAKICEWMEIRFLSPSEDWGLACKQRWVYALDSSGNGNDWALAHFSTTQWPLASHLCKGRARLKCVRGNAGPGNVVGEGYTNEPGSTHLQSQSGSTPIRKHAQRRGFANGAGRASAARRTRPLGPVTAARGDSYPEGGSAETPSHAFTCGLTHGAGIACVPNHIAGQICLHSAGNNVSVHVGFTQGADNEGAQVDPQRGTSSHAAERTCPQGQGDGPQESRETMQGLALAWQAVIKD